MIPTSDNMSDEFEDEDERDDSGSYERFSPGIEWQPLHQDATYSAYARDDEYMWRWNIVRDGNIIQEGCSISLETARRSVGHVLAFYAISEGNRAGKGQKDEEFRE